MAAHEQEHLPKNYQHPCTGRVTVDVASKSLEYRLALIVDTNALGQADRTVFEMLFPDNRDPKPFELKTIKHAPETDMTEGQKEVRRQRIEQWGLVSPRDDPEGTRYVRSSVNRLRVGFTDKHHHITSLLQKIPMVENLKHVGQWRFGNFAPDLRHRDEVMSVTRWDHVAEMMMSTAMTLTRWEELQPKLLEERIMRDVAQYLWLAIIDPNIPKDIKFGDHLNPLLDTNTPLRERVNLYGKYLLTAVALHDAFTPALGDLVMRVRGIHIGQADSGISEDELLKNEIFHLLDNIDQVPPELFTTQGLDKKLLGVMIYSLAAESDFGLAGHMLKDKRKYPEDSSIPFLEQLRKRAAWDLDQESGTVVSFEYLAEYYLPGGFRFMLKTDTPPIGSFRERLRLLMYARLTGMRREQVASELKKLGISDPMSIYIAKEEFSVWHNMVLMDVPFIDESGHTIGHDIVPVSVEPSDINQALLAFNAVSLFQYREGRTNAYETFMRDILGYAFGKAKGDKEYIDPQMFLMRHDADALTMLQMSHPLVAYLEGLLRHNPSRIRYVSAAEVEKLARESQLENTLMIEANRQYIIDLKPGTFIRGDDGKVLMAMELLSTRLEGENRVPNPDGLIPRLQRIDAFLSKEAEHMYLITFTHDDIDQLRKIFLLQRGNTGAPFNTFVNWTSEVSTVTGNFAGDTSLIRRIFEPPNKPNIPDS